jgi:hypothetical protein
LKKWKDLVRQAKVHSALYCKWKKKMENTAICRREIKYRIAMEKAIFKRSFFYKEI